MNIIGSLKCFSTIFLPPANEVQGSMHSRGMDGRGMHGRGHVWQGWGVQGEGVCVAGEMATEAGDKHPTGMHSCYK